MRAPRGGSRQLRGGGGGDGVRGGVADRHVRVRVPGAVLRRRPPLRRLPRGPPLGPVVKVPYPARDHQIYVFISASLVYLHQLQPLCPAGDHPVQRERRRLPARHRRVKHLLEPP